MVIEVIEVKTPPGYHIGKAGVVWVFGLDITHFIERIETFVHPAMNAFVGAQYAIKPVVPYFVYNNYFEFFLIACIANNRDHWVFHAAACANGAVDSRDVFVRVIAIPK